MLDLIQDYVSGDFGEGIYNPVLWFMAWIVLATLVTGAILAISTWWRERRLKADLPDDPLDAIQRRIDDAKRILDPPARFSMRHLITWHPIAVVALAAMSAASLWFGWQIVVLPLAAATAVTYVWHFHLRRSGVRWAATYSLASWIVPYLLVVVTIILYRPSALEMPWPTYWEHAFVYSRLNELDPQTLTFIFLWSLAASVLSLMFAKWRQPPINPGVVATMVCPTALYVWFVHDYWGVPLGAFTMVLIGHAMSRERRLRLGMFETLHGKHHGTSDARWPDMLEFMKRFDPFVAMLAIASVAIVALDYDLIAYDWMRVQLRDYELHWVWFDVMRTALFWAPLLACGYFGIAAMRKVAGTAQVEPYVATAIVIALMSHALFESEWYFRLFTQSEFIWTADPETFDETYIEMGYDSAAYVGPRLVYPSEAGMPLVLSYLVAVVLLIASFWQGARGTLANYGGALCGMAWFVIAYWVYELTVNSSLRGGHYIGFWQYMQTDLLLANLTIAAIAMFALLYWGFGPGSIRTDPHQPRL